MLQTWSRCRFYHIRGWGTRNWWNYLSRTHAWPINSDCDVTITVTFCISFNANDTGLMLVLIITKFEFEELKNYETIYVELTREPPWLSECDVKISVTCRSYSNANDTILMLVSISPYLRLRNSKMRKERNDVPLARDLTSDWRHDVRDLLDTLYKWHYIDIWEILKTRSWKFTREWYVISFLMFEFPNYLEYGRIDTVQDRICSICIWRHMTGHRNHDVTVTF